MDGVQNLRASRGDMSHVLSQTDVPRLTACGVPDGSRQTEERSKAVIAGPHDHCRNEGTAAGVRRTEDDLWIR